MDGCRGQYWQPLKLTQFRSERLGWHAIFIWAQGGVFGAKVSKDGLGHLSAILDLEAAAYHIANKAARQALPQAKSAQCVQLATLWESPLRMRKVSGAHALLQDEAQWVSEDIWVEEL